MSKIKIAFQGEPGAYSHIAINEVFKNPEIKTCSTFEETFKTAFEDDSYKIIIPLENSFFSIFFSVITLTTLVSFSSLSISRLEAKVPISHVFFFI